MNMQRFQRIERSSSLPTVRSFDDGGVPLGVNLLILGADPEHIINRRRGESLSPKVLVSIPKKCDIGAEGLVH